jgi:Family of unknown function (DUF6308)
VNAAVAPLTLRNGATVNDPLATALEFIAQDSSYKKYDLAPVAHDSELTLEDIRVGNWMIARMSPQVMKGIYARSSEINSALAEIPPSATLAAPNDAVSWRALTSLMQAIHGAPEVGLARATKVLHKKRPALIPILDSVLEKYLRGVERLRRTGDFADDAVALMKSYKRELDAALPVLRSLQFELRARSVDLTECRLLDLFLWGYSGTYTPLYLREGGTTAAPSLTPRGRGVAVSPEGSLQLFRDNDRGYLRWLNEHPRGFVLNAARTPRANYLILHRATCRTISGQPARGGPWTGPFIKVCADDPLEIAAWTGATVAAAPRRCRTCRP